MIYVKYITIREERQVIIRGYEDTQLEIWQHLAKRYYLWFIPIWTSVYHSEVIPTAIYFQASCLGSTDWVSPHKDIISKHYVRQGKDDLNRQCLAPLWQQAFDWFREKHSFDLFIKPMSFVGVIQYYDIEIYHPKYVWDSPPKVTGKTYEEARQACLEKLIELCQEN